MKRVGFSFAAWISVFMLAALTAPPAADAATISTVGAIPGFVDGTNPSDGLIELGGKYYGSTTHGGPAGAGTVFSMNLRTGVETVVYALTAADGQYALGLTAVAGKLYGETLYGGPQNSGTVFQVDPATGAEQVIFNKPYETYLGLAAGPNGSLYGYGQCGGTGISCIYQFDTGAATGKIIYTFNNSSDGSGPEGLLLVGQYLVRRHQ